MSTRFQIDRPTGGSVRDEEIGTLTRTIADLVDDTGYLRNRTRIYVDDWSMLHRSTEGLHTESLRQLHRIWANDRVKESMTRLIERLSDLGFSWRDIARVSGVSVPALRKWRHGKPATGTNRKRVAMVVAFCEIARDQYLIDDVAGWVETPIHPSTPISGLDLIAEERFDLALQMADDRNEDPEVVLDQFEPEWRERYASPIEVFMAPDGIPGLRLAEREN